MPTATLNGWIWALTTGFNPSSPFAGSNPSAQPHSSVILARRETYRKSPDIPCVSSRRLGLWRPLIRILEPKSVRFGPQSQFESLQFPFLQRAADQRLICSTLRLVRQWAQQRDAQPAHWQT